MEQLWPMLLQALVSPDPLFALGYKIFGVLLALAFRKELAALAKGRGQPSIRDKCHHRYIRGVIGAGKSTFLYNLFLTETATHGGLIISTHGLKDLLQYLKPEHVERTWVISPARERPKGINLLQRYTNDENERLLIADQTVALFAKIDAKSWGGNMAELVYAAVLAILEAQEHMPELKQATLWDVYKFMVDEQWRNDVLVYVSTSTVHHAYANPPSQSMAAALRRMRRMLTNSMLVSTLAQPDGLDLQEVIKRGEIVVADLDEGEIGPDTASFLGEVLMSKSYLASTGRHDKQKAFYLYFDEFQVYANNYVKRFVEECRKRAMLVTLAHQRAGQLTKDMQEAVALCGSWYIFRLSVDDAREIARAFPEDKYSWQLFNRIPLFTIIYRQQLGAKIEYGVRKTRPLPKKQNLDKQVWERNSQGPTRSEIVARVEKRAKGAATECEEVAKTKPSWTF